MAKLAPTQIEQLQSIGAYLRQVRQEQGMSLDMLANQIFIRPALLRAVEEGQGTELPEPVFIQGFIRRYAEALGLDGQAIAQEFRVTPVDVVLTPDALTPAEEAGAGNPQPRPSTRLVDQPPPAMPRSGRSPWPLALSLAALAAILGLGAWGLLARQGDPSRANSGANSSDESAVLPADQPPADPSETATPEPNEPPLAALPESAEDSPAAPLEAPVVVSANLSDRAWLSVVADGTNVYEGIAESGFEETWTAQTSLVFRTGNAGGVSLSVNGDRPTVVGDSGVVRTLTLTPESGAESIQTP